MLKRFWWMFPVMMVVGPFVGFMLAVLLNRMFPKHYESETVIEVKPLIMTQTSSSISPAHSTERREDLAESIKNTKVLALTAENLKLAHRWGTGKDETLAMLTRIVNVGPIRGTDLWSIRVRHTDNVLARDIAIEVARAYKEREDQIRSRQAESILRVINEEVSQQEDVVEDLRKQMAVAAEKGSDASVYADAQNEFATAQDLLQNLKLKQMGETISRKIPNESVEVHMPAVISNAPVSPNVTRNLVLGTAIGFLFSPLMALLMIWLLGRLMPDSVPI